MKEILLEKIARREVVAAVLGLGYVGLPLAVEKAKAGFRTLGLDVQEQKVRKVNAGENYIGDVVDSELADLVARGRLRATTDFTELGKADFVAICVPTPLDAHQQPDLSYVRQAARNIAPFLHPGSMVVLESTTYPGTTEELVLPLLEAGSGLVCGRDFYLGFSPERVDPGNRRFKTRNTPKVVGAVGAEAREVIGAMYAAILGDKVHPVSSPAVAEMTKLLENTYRNVNIGLINELAQLCERMKISIWEVVDAAKTKPFGFTPFYPGPGLGGHCIPLDPYYLSWKAREYGFHTSMIEASMMVNDAMPRYCVQRAANLLNQRGKALKEARVLVLGVAYKQAVADCRESPALRVMELLEERGAQLAYHDPYVPAFTYKGRHYVGQKSLSPALLEAVDLVLVATAHPGVDYALVQRHAPAVFDAKNVMKDIRPRHNIEVL